MPRQYTPRDLRDYPTIKELAADIHSEWRAMRRTCTREEISDGLDLSTAGMDVRLQVVGGEGWMIHTGDPSFDTDHRGYWGAGFLPWKRPNCYELARELIDQARDQEAY